MLHDLVGVSDDTALERDCGIVLLLFFLGAGLANIFNSGIVEGNPLEILKCQIAAARVPMIWYVAVLVTFPILLLCEYIAGNYHVQLWVFCVYFFVIGAFYGFIFSRVQESAWRLIPDGASTSSAWGFYVMCRLLGFDLGCVLAGFILDMCRSSSSDQYYHSYGFTLIFCGCAVFVLVARAILRPIAEISEEDLDKAGNRACKIISDRGADSPLSILQDNLTDKRAVEVHREIDQVEER